ncbi:hypothetical protein M9H77_27651 [Catharanthus roseus]|uniref:Uncharacterized protein n=1 Tax=Catharanthus roseus TaxID=4058 RepID=A0ACC0AD46_CATRO|nr:hypothetical protein M9H77_27651 [Catharanthus roseus]
MNIRNCVIGTQHASHIEVWHQWRLHIRDGSVLVLENLSSPGKGYIRWYQDITRVYIGHPANRDTRTVGYQPAGVDRRMMTSMLRKRQLTTIHNRHGHVGGRDNSQ